MNDMERITENDPLSKSADILAANVNALRLLFPEVFSEGKIDFEKLKETLGEYTENEEERFSFNWNGKQQARREAQKRSTGTLRPCVEESVDWDNTQNLYLEGDNLEVLKILQKSYHGKVKMIYIDPPYNTGRDFIYDDDYSDNLANYLDLTGQADDQGRRLGTNSDTSGRYHSNWLNMMYPRMRLARNLLKDDGVVFISIDDNEVHDLRLLMNEIFGEENFIASVIWQKVFSPKNSARYFSEDHDFVLVYAKRADLWSPELLPRSQEAKDRYKNPDDDRRGPWSSSDLAARNFYSKGEYNLTAPGGKVFSNPKGSYWRVSKEKFHELEADGRIWWGEEKNNMPRLKRFISEVKDGVVPQTIWKHKEVGNTQEAKKELLKYVEFENTGNVLNSVKPTRLLKRMLQIGTKSTGNDIVLDFFSGSGPMAQAVLDQNKTDQGNRKFILVQFPEPLPIPEEKVKTIPDLAKSRIRNYIKEVKETAKMELALNPIEHLDLGFKVFKLDSSNLKTWDPDTADLESTLFDYIDHIKEGRSQEDLLYEILLKYGLNLTLPIEKLDLAGKKVYNVGLGALWVCLEQEIGHETVEMIGKRKQEQQPETCRVVFKDSGFKDDAAKTNAIQTLKRYDINEVRSI
jgi:adenine-specific DNA-methyltransferase